MNRITSKSYRGLFCLIASLVLLVALCGCAHQRPPQISLPSSQPDRVPVIFIPGTTGTKLMRVDTERVLWGNGRSLYFPRDRGYALTLPLSGSAAERAPESAGIVEIAPSAPFLQLNFLGYKKRVYGPWVEWMEQHGYHYESLRAPTPDGSFFFFEYDWRRSNIDAARLLSEQLEALRKIRGESTLRVHLIGQSNGALIARYLARFGGADLEQAESGETTPPTKLEIEKVVFVGAAHAGALRVLREMQEGRSYAPLGRKWTPEVLFSFPALYEALPAPFESMFLDPEAKALDVDLFDPSAWETWGWSLFAKDVSRRIEGNPLFGSLAERQKHLRVQLDRARRFQSLLLTDPDGFESPEILSIQNLYLETPVRAVLDHRKNGDPRIRFGSDRAIKKDMYLEAQVHAPGDGHASGQTQSTLSLKEIKAMADRKLFVPGDHFEIVLHPLAQRRALEFLLEID